MSVTVTFAGSGDAFGTGGRFNTCLLVDAPESRFAVDFGASSMIALHRLGVAHNDLDAVLLSHHHADHAAGLPSLILDATLVTRRQHPLVIAGPVGTRDYLERLMETLFPGASVIRPRFELRIEEIETGRPVRLGAIELRTYPAEHTPETNPTSMRISVGGKVIAFTGDSAWTEHIPALSAGADLLISECYSYDRDLPMHMSYATLKAHWGELGAKRVILTHMGPEMLARADEIAEECAWDGMIVTL